MSTNLLLLFFTVATDITDISMHIATIFTLATNLVTSVTHCYYFLSGIFQFILGTIDFRVATQLFLAQKIATAVGIKT
jgi:hypothetical protein